MKRGMIFFVTLSLLAMTAMTDSWSWSITVQPGPVEVKQGNNVTLWCEMKQDTKNVVPVHWQSPPSFRTRTSNCVSFVKEKYGISCGVRSRWYNMYNMTINDVQWADRGKYRCIHTRHMSTVDLKVLVPVREVSLTHVSNITSETELLVLSKGVNAVLTCKTNCAYPAPSISWFENDELFNGSASVNKTELGCTREKEGQKRTRSTITVTGKYANQERKESKIFCVAENIIGEPTVSTAININYAVTTRQPQVVTNREHPTKIAVISLGGTVLFGVRLILMIGLIIFIKKKRAGGREKLLGGTSDPPKVQMNDNDRSGTYSTESSQLSTKELI